MGTIDKAVWVEDLGRTRDVVELLGRTYSNGSWTGAMIFHDHQGGLLLVACFDPELYPRNLPAWESLFPARDLRAVTMAEACADGRRYHPHLAGGIAVMLGHLKLLP